MTPTATDNTTLNCPACGSNSKRFGRHRNGLQRYRCVSENCQKTFTEGHEAAFRIEDYLLTDQGRFAIKLLLEGTSVRSAERLTGLHRDAILRLLVEAGKRCEKLVADRIRN